MFDIWAFLLQTLTASGVAALLLVIKALFKDKLPPKWHFLVWSVLGITILFPVGLNGRYILFHWQVAVEIVKGWFGDYSFTRVLFPIPFLNAVPETFLDWVFAVYVFGVVVFIAKYIVSYIRLRYVLSKGTELHDETLSHIRQIAAEQKIKLCKVVEVPGMPGAFVCGIVRPILAVSEKGELDDKIILHELFHLKHRDTFWSALICFLRCIHWCNPLLIYCLNRAINDMESRCDQYVLESLEGEERRDYGRILLSMSNERFAKTPGSTCINNGGKNIRERIEAIARFKKYPAGMGLVSGCVMLVLTFSLVVGVRASSAFSSALPSQIALASARGTPCTTYAGAFDAYAKAVLTHSAVYRTMCAPASVQAEIAEKKAVWDRYLDMWFEADSGYYVYNLKQINKNTYEGLLVIKLRPSVEDEDGKTQFAVQNVRVEKEDGRWTAVPLDEFRRVASGSQTLSWGNWDLPGFSYTGTASDVLVEVKVQTVRYVDSWVKTEGNFLFGSGEYFDTTPNPDAEFTEPQRQEYSFCTLLGNESERNSIKKLGLSASPVFSGEKRPDYLHSPDDESFSENDCNGAFWDSCILEPDWGPEIIMGGHGTSFDPLHEADLPEYYAADLYINGKLVSQLDLYLQEGAEK